MGCIGLTGCVSPAPTTAVYEAKAALSAADAVSAARTAVLSVQTYRQGKLTTAALEVLLQESEATLESVSGTFDSLQPPDTAAAQDLDDTLGQLLTDATDDARDLRIAARRGDTAQLDEAGTSLSKTADELDAFAQEHQS
jgi:hypothetical protein